MSGPPAGVSHGRHPGNGKGSGGRSAANLQTTETLVRQALPRREQILTAARIISGHDESPDGDEYQPELVQHIWQVLRQINKNSELSPELVAGQPSSTLMRRCFYGSAVTISGRLRGHVGFSQCANTPFQGLAADGNKLALFRLLRAGYQVCGFVHDEMVVLIPDGTDYSAAVLQVQQILADAMQELTPDISINTEYLLADRWYKDVDEQPTDTAGRIIPYRKQTAAVLIERKRAPPRQLRKLSPAAYDPETIWSFCDPGPVEQESSSAAKGNAPQIHKS